MRRLPLDNDDRPIQAFRLGGVVTRLNLGSVAATTPVFPEQALVRICADIKCHIAVGANAVATTDNLTFEAGTEVFVIPAGSRLSVISADGDSGIFEIAEGM